MTRLIVFLVSLALFMLPFSGWLSARYGVEYPRSALITRDSELNPALLDSLSSRRPELVLLGNSMVGAGIDEKQFDELVPESVFKLGIHGAASSLWYLVLKNFVCTLDPPPQVVLLFFRDTFLTWPEFRVDGKYRDIIDRYAGPNEVLLDRLAYLDGMNRLSYLLTVKFPLWGEREKLRDDLVGVAKFGIPMVLVGTDSTGVDQAIARTFADSNMSEDLLTAVQLDAEETKEGADHQDFESRLKEAVPAELE